MLDSVIILWLMINEKQNYLSLKASIRVKDTQLGDIQRNRLTGHGKRIRITEIFKQKERQNLKLKCKV